MPTCIVIDDEPLLAKRMSEQIREMLPGWTVVSETDPVRALAFIDSDMATLAIALCVVDLGLPVIGGEEIIRRTLAKRPDLRGHVIVWTGGIRDFSQEKRLFGELGCVRLDKPYMSDELRAALRLAVPGG